MNFTRTKFLENLIPQYIREEYPLFTELVKQYYSYLDRKHGEIIAIKIINPGKNYPDNTLASIKIKDQNIYSDTYGTYIADTKGASLTPIVVNGRIEKIIVNSYGTGYTNEDSPIVSLTQYGNGIDFESSVVWVSDIGNINEATTNLINSRDIDGEIFTFINFLTSEYISKIPINNLYTTTDASVELTKFVKFIKQFYNSAGIEDSVKFLYRILFNTTVDFYYPKVDMLRVSDGKWNIDNKIKITPVNNLISNFRELYVGNRILGKDSNANAIIQSVEELGSYFELVISNIKGTFTANEDILEFPISGDRTKIGVAVQTNGSVLYKSTGKYLNDDGFPSSRKKIQDSRYYQDFSYELQSDESIRKFQTILESLVHPAGFVFFIRFNLVTETESLDDSLVDQESNISTYPKMSYELIRTPDSNSLGPINSDVDDRKGLTYPIKYVDFTNTATASSPVLTFPSDLPSDTFISINDYYANFSAVITQSGTTWYRKINSYNPTTRAITLDSSITAATGSTVTCRLIQNRRLKSINTSTRKIELDEKWIPYSSIPISTLGAALTNSSGATGVFLFASDTYNVKVGDTLRVDSEDLLVNYTSGSTGVGVFGLSVTRGYNSTTIASHTIGATAYNKTDHRYRNWFVFITSGPASGQYSKITDYGATGINGATGVITYSASYTLHAAGSTAPTVDSTYWLYPDFAGTANVGYYTTGATGISSLTIADGGLGATGATAVSLVFSASQYGTTAAATGVLTNGVLTSASITNSGSGYIFPPTVTVNYIGATSIRQAMVYADISDISATDTEQVYDYSEFAGVVLNTNINQVYKRAKARTEIKPATIVDIIDLDGKSYIILDVNNVDNISGYVQFFDNLGNTFWKLATGNKFDNKIILNNSTGLNITNEVVGYGIGYNTRLKRCVITNPGSGYTKIPNVQLIGGGGSGAYARATISNGTVDTLILYNDGVNYTSPAEVIIEDSIPPIGERVKQPSTGARGVIEDIDYTNNLIYVLKDRSSPDFVGATGININGININLNSISSIYKTTGKQINRLPESEITVI